MTAVPAVIGFASPVADVLEWGGAPAVALDRWNEAEFERSVRPAAGSFLHIAVRGFFANGGRRCVVLVVPPDAGSAGLVRVLQRGGPLEDRDDIDLICVPDAVSPRVGDFDPYAVHAAALAHCEATGDRFAILDARDFSPAGDQAPVNDVLGTAMPLKSPFGALYFPFIAVDRSGDGQTPMTPSEGSHQWRNLPRPRLRDHPGRIAFGPPCGHIAGLFARIDARVGPQRAPANIALEDAVDVSFRLSEEQHALLNDGGVNCLRNIRGRGIEVGGARTRSGHSDWAYISTARVILGFRRWLAVGMRDLVFEPLSTELWDRIRLRLVAHCLALLRSGALAGDDAAQAFFVKCDEETNRPNEVDLGRVVALVGLAPSVPAEFIIVRVEHDASGVTVSSLA